MKTTRTELTRKTSPSSEDYIVFNLRKKILEFIQSENEHELELLFRYYEEENVVESRKCLLVKAFYQKENYRMTNFEDDPLFLAIFHGLEKAVKLFLPYCDVNRIISVGTPLHFAIEIGSPAIVKQLLQLNTINPQVKDYLYNEDKFKDKPNNTPFHKALYFLKVHADFPALKQRYLAIAEMLIKDKRTSLTCPDYRNKTPLAIFKEGLQKYPEVFSKLKSFIDEKMEQDRAAVMKHNVAFFQSMPKSPKPASPKLNITNLQSLSPVVLEPASPKSGTDLETVSLVASPNLESAQPIITKPLPRPPIPKALPIPPKPLLKPPVPSRATRPALSSTRMPHITVTLCPAEAAQEKIITKEAQQKRMIFANSRQQKQIIPDNSPLPSNPSVGKTLERSDSVQRLNQLFKNHQPQLKPESQLKSGGKVYLTPQAQQKAVTSELELAFKKRNRSS